MEATRKTPANKGKRYAAEALSREDIDAILKKCSRRAPTGIRNRGLLVLLWRCGLRISEALSLAPRDVDLEAGVVTIRNGKAKPRTKAEIKAGAPLKKQARKVGLPHDAADALQRWLEVRRKLGINGRSVLFTTLQGRPMSASYVRTLLPRLARKAGVEARVHAHAFRHTYAAELRRERVDLGVISRALGHSSLTVTNRYANHLEPSDVIEATRAREDSDAVETKGKKGQNGTLAALQAAGINVQTEAQLAVLRSIFNAA